MLTVTDHQREEARALIAKAQEEAKAIVRHTPPDEVFAELVTETVQFNSEYYQKLLLREGPGCPRYLAGLKIDFPSKGPWTDVKLSVYTKKNLDECGGFLWPIIDFLVLFGDVPEEVHARLYRLEVLKWCLDRHKDSLEHLRTQFSDAGERMLDLVNDLRRYIGEECVPAKGNLLVFREHADRVLRYPLRERLEDVRFEDGSVRLIWYELYVPRLHWNHNIATTMQLYYLPREMLVTLARLKVLTDLIDVRAVVNRRFAAEPAVAGSLLSTLAST